MHDGERIWLTQLPLLGLAQLKSVWKPFDIEFGDLEKDLQRRNEDVNDELRLASEQAASDYRKSGSLFRNSVIASSKKEQAWRLQVDERKSSKRPRQRWLTNLTIGGQELRSRVCSTNFRPTIILLR